MPDLLSPRRILFVNDCGFLGGAGIALRRQVASLLLTGSEVGVLCWMRQEADDLRNPRGIAFTGRWLGVDRRPALHLSAGLSVAAIARRVLEAILEKAPDLVVFGNLHWAGWPLDIISGARDAGIPTIVYLHDVHWVTGRCVYSGDCRRFVDVCDEHCPTADEYPPLRPALIKRAYQARRELFTGERRLKLATNSTWMTKSAIDGFAGNADVRTLWLGLDSNLFRPFNQIVARRLLGLPTHKLIVILGAIDLGEARKGGNMLREAVAALKSDPSILLLGFGHNSESYSGVHGVGNIVDERQMSILFAASDLMLNAAKEEAFGQTLMEAAACGLPIVGTDVGGVKDIARPYENAVLVPYGDVGGLVENVRRLAQNADIRQAMGRASRSIVEADFTLERQASNWTSLIQETMRESVIGAGSL